MSQPLIVYWSSNSGGTRRVAEALNTNTVELSDYDGTSPYVLLTPTYDQPRGGFTPKPVQAFLNKHARLMVGVAGSGNMNFGEHYCQAAIDISKQHGVPIVHRIDIMGTVDDYRTIDAGMAQHWRTLLKMRGIQMITNSRERKIETGATMPTIKRYRKRPVAIEAVQLNIHNVREVAKWCGADLGYTFGSAEPDSLHIPTLEGEMAAHIDDYIIRGVAGEFYPCRSDIFDQTYESVTSEE